jgi:hypothetical protein
MWNKLSMRDKANYIKLAIKNNITSLKDIQDIYNKYSEGGDIILPELIVNQKGAYTNYTGNETITPTLEEYMQAKADETRYNAAFSMERQRVPVVPIVPDRSTKGKALLASVLDRLGVKDEEILNIVGENPTPFTCAYTATSQYPESSRVPGNITFSEDPSKYGFVKSSDPKIGDLVVSIRGQHPAHMSMVTSKTDWDYPLVSYSKGGAEPKDMVYNRLDWMRDLPRSTFYTYKGTEEEKKKWKKEYKKLYNSKK